MELKVKFLKWNAGIPTAMLSKESADEIGLHTGDRISIRTISKYPKETSLLVDTIEGLVRKNEIALSSEIKQKVNLRKGQIVDVNLAQTPKSVVAIKKKLEDKRLTDEEINEIVKEVVNNSLSQAEIAMFISSMYVNGMNFKETISLIKAILKNGNLLSLKDKFVVDKHSIGGIPGNRTTPIVVSICAAAGLIMPKTSSRAITSAAGTADVIETVANVEFKVKDLRKIIQKTGACMVWGGALGMVPADSKIINTEKLLKIDPESQLLASIMAKKLAVGSRYILIDIPYGKGAKVDKKKALHLKKKFERIGKYFRRKLKVVLTDGTQPIGNGIGPVLELIDLMNVLDPVKIGPKDLEDKAIFLASEILEMTGKAKKGKGEILAKEMISSGKAYKKFKDIIKAQGGDFKKIKPSKLSHDIIANKSGRIDEIENKPMNELARAAGCPVDKSSGLYLHFHVGDKVKKGDKILTIHSETKTRLNSAINFYKSKNPIKIK